MIIREEIRNYEVTSALPAELIKTSREYYVLAVLKHSFPDCFSKLRKAESPDLQALDGDVGIEVTWGGSPRNELISGESVKYSHARNAAEKEKILRKIRENGGNRDEIATSYPIGTAEGDKQNDIRVFKKKLEKVDGYRKRFQNIGLAIMIDIPLFFFGDQSWGKWLSDINNNAFDFVALVHWSGVDIYDFRFERYSRSRISRKDRDALQRLGRMAAEGIIKDDDSVWD